MANEVTVVRAPSYPDHFRAKLIPGLGDIPAKDSRGNLAVITWGDGEIGVVPARCIVQGAVDWVKRFEVDFDWFENSWGVRHAFGGPFVHHGAPVECQWWIKRKTS